MKAERRLGKFTENGSYVFHEQDKDTDPWLDQLKDETNYTRLQKIMSEVSPSKSINATPLI